MHRYVSRWCAVLWVSILLFWSVGSAGELKGNPGISLPVDCSAHEHITRGIEIGTNNGSLSGYVYSSAMDPLGGAVVIVFFHGTYEMSFTDVHGYYHVTNISICNCTKRVVACMQGFQGEEVFLSIYENTTYDFFLDPLSGADVSCWGDLMWTDVYPGEIVQGTIWVMNQGGDDLRWNISQVPNWGIWDVGSFFPVIPPGGLYIVTVHVIAPSQPYANFSGYVQVVNQQNSSDFCMVNTSLSTQGTIGYAYSERILAFIGDLHVEENLTSFSAILGMGLCVIEYDDGGMVAFIRLYVLSAVCWSGDFLFQGVLRSHFVKGTVCYRVAL